MSHESSGAYLLAEELFGDARWGCGWAEGPRALGAGGTVQACFNLPDGVYEMKSASTKYLAHEPSWKDVNSPSPTLTSLD